MLVGIAILCFIYAPLLTFLRAPPTKEEKKVGGIDNVGMVPEIDVSNGVVVVVNNSTTNGICENYVTKF